MFVSGLMSCSAPDSGEPFPRPLFARRWFTRVAEHNGWGGLPAISSNVLVIARTGGLAGFDTATGKPLWTTDVWHTGQGSFVGNVVARDGVACLADFFGIGCVDVATGHLLWANPPDSATQYGESDVDGDALYYGTAAHQVVAVDLRTGATRWRADIAPDAKYLTRVFGVTVRGDTVYAATVHWLTWNGSSMVGDLVALARSDGHELWRFAPTDTGRTGFQGAPVLAGNMAVVNDPYAHVLRAIDLSTAREAWRSAVDPSGYITAETPPVVVGDTVFTGSTDTQIYALRLNDGTRIWRVFGDGNSLGSISVCDRSVVALPFIGGTPIVVDRATHRMSRPNILEPDDEVRSRVLVAHGSAYAESNDGVYRFTCR